MWRNYVQALLALLICAGLYLATLASRGIAPAHRSLVARSEGHFTEGAGWYPGEPFVTAQPVRAWGSWCGSDVHHGTVTLGPFSAPERLRFAVGGYGARTHA